jgi:hypothetical protein
MICRIVVDGDTAEIFSPFQAKDIIRSVPTRTWNKTRKCWSINESFVNMAADALREAHHEVFVTRADGKRYTSSGTHGSRSTPAPNWVNEAFQAAPKDRVDKLRRGLLSAFHPDHGGSHEISVKINQAADQVLRGGRRG